MQVDDGKLYLRDASIVSGEEDNCFVLHQYLEKYCGFGPLSRYKINAQDRLNKLAAGTSFATTNADTEKSVDTCTLAGLNLASGQSHCAKKVCSRNDKNDSYINSSVSEKSSTDRKLIFREYSSSFDSTQSDDDTEGALPPFHGEGTLFTCADQKKSLMKIKSMESISANVNYNFEKYDYMDNHESFKNIAARKVRGGSRKSSAQEQHELWLKQLSDQKREEREIEKKRVLAERQRRQQTREDLNLRARQRASNVGNDPDNLSQHSKSFSPLYAKETLSARNWIVEKNNLPDETNVKLPNGPDHVERIALLRREKKENYQNYLMQLSEKRKLENERIGIEERRKKEMYNKVKEHVLNKVAKYRLEKLNLPEEHPISPSNDMIRELHGTATKLVLTEVEHTDMQPCKPTQDIDEAERRKYSKLIRIRAQKHIDELNAQKQAAQIEVEKAEKEALERSIALRKVLEARAKKLKSRQEIDCKENEGEEKSMEKEKKFKYMSNTEIAESAARLSKRSITIDSTMDSRILEKQSYIEWKRKKGIDIDTKVFVMSGWYPSVRHALQSRGWYHNTDQYSSHFDLRWALHGFDSKAPPLLSWQTSNHFPKNGCITTKVGLIETMKGIVYHCDFDSENIFPRSYYLSNQSDILAFIEDFKITAVVNLLKHVLLCVDRGNKYNSIDDCTSDTSSNLDDSDLDITSTTAESEKSFEKSKRKGKNSDFLKYKSSEGKDMLICADIVDTAISVCYRHICTLLNLEDACIHTGMKDSMISANEQKILPLEWELISLCGPDFSGLTKKHFLSDTTKANTLIFPEKDTAMTIQQLKKFRNQRSKFASSLQNDLVPIGQMRVKRIRELLQNLKSKCKQFDLDGSFGSNIWIVKPAAKSRGRGIACYTDLSRILEYSEKVNEPKHEKWIVQKYIENPFLISNRKFDIRQWVLVTDFNPLTIFYCEKCYLRFGVEKYSSSNLSLQNRYIHLVNNSIGKTSERFNEISYAENGKKIEGYMWNIDSFTQYLDDTRSEEKNIYEKSIKPRLIDIVIMAMKSARETIETRKNTWELFGFDFMIDESLNPWLIEINSSPACDYSTAVTEQFVKEALLDIVKVTVDLKNWEEEKIKSPLEKMPDTGIWKLIHKDTYIPNPISSLGAEMMLKGTRMRKI